MKSVLILLALTVAAFAAPPPGADPESPIAIWYKSLHRPFSGISCCSIADCRPVKARVIDGHYQVWHETEWLAVDDWHILPQMENLAGEPVACIYDGTVLCLVRGPEG